LSTCIQTVVLPCAEIVACDGLHPLVEPHDDHHEEEGQPVDDTVGPDHQVAAVLFEPLVDEDDDEAGRHVHQKGRHADGHVTHMYLGLNSVLRSAGHPRKSMYATINTVVINTILDPNLLDNPLARPVDSPVEMQQFARIGEQPELPDERDHLRQHRGDRCAADAPAEAVDEQRGEDRVGTCIWD